MWCETENGAKHEVSTSAELDGVFANMGGDGHIILGTGANFVQVSREGESAVLLYREGEVTHQAIDPVSLPAAQKMLQGYLHGDPMWKSAVRWEAPHGNAKTDSIEQGRSRLSGMLADDTMRAVKPKAGRLHRGFRRFLR